MYMEQPTKDTFFNSNYYRVIYLNYDVCKLLLINNHSNIIVIELTFCLVFLDGLYPQQIVFLLLFSIFVEAFHV